MIKSFRATDNFEEVLSQVGAHNTSLRTTFPRKIFTAEDAGKTLEDLGMCMLSYASIIIPGYN